MLTCTWLLKTETLEFHNYDNPFQGGKSQFYFHANYSPKEQQAKSLVATKTFDLPTKALCATIHFTEANLKWQVILKFLQPCTSYSCQTSVILTIDLDINASLTMKMLWTMQAHLKLSTFTQTYEGISRFCKVRRSQQANWDRPTH